MFELDTVSHADCMGKRQRRPRWNDFRVTPLSVHQIVLTLETRVLIERTPGLRWSIRLLIPVRNCRIWSKTHRKYRQPAQSPPV